MKVLVVAILGLGSTTTSAFAPIRPWMAPSQSVTPSVRAMTETPVATTESGSARESQVEDFQNDGPFSWMIPYLGMMGMEDGKVLTYGVLTSEPDTNQQSVSPEEATAAREEAMQQMMNIGVEERRRRDQVGDIMIPLTAAYAVLSALIFDDGGITGHLARFAIVVPLFLARGYKVSAETGLCNVAQKGLWDVDGQGLTKIEDPVLARRLLDRVNAMNIQNGLQATGIAALFAVLPKATTQSAAIVVALCAVLYLLQDKLPKEIE
jgi:hypothetical protein